MLLQRASRLTTHLRATTRSAGVATGRTGVTNTSARLGNWVVPASMLLTTGLGVYCCYDNRVFTSHAFAEGTSAPAAFSPKEFRSFTLEKKEPINYNTSVFRFKLPSDEHVTGLHVASCVVTRYPVKKEDGSTGYVIRPYTPTSDEQARGYVEFVIKDYPQGKMSRHIHSLKPGDQLDIKGPIPKYNWDQGKVQNVGMIAGGTGITPMLQLIRKIFGASSTDNDTKVTLIFANQNEDDILLKEELDSYAKSFPKRFKVVYILDKPSKDWKGHKGFVNGDLIKDHLPLPETPSSTIFVCGPDAMLASMAGPKAPDFSQGELGGILKQLGYAPDQVYKF